MNKFKKFDINNYLRIPDLAILVMLMLSSMKVIPPLTLFYNIYIIAEIIITVILYVFTACGMIFLPKEDITSRKRNHTDDVTEKIYLGIYYSAVLVSFVLYNDIGKLFVLNIIINIVGRFIVRMIANIKNISLEDSYIRQERTPKNDKIVREYLDMRDMIKLNSSGKEQEKLLKELERYYIKLIQI